MSQEKDAKYQHGARDVFLYLLVVFTLVTVAVTTGSITFDVINALIPDVADQSYDIGNTGLKMSIATLLVTAPIFYFLMRQINRLLYSGKMASKSMARQWLIYLALLIAALNIIGYTIAVIFSFLDGDLTSRFLLKALTVFVIAGMVFGYFIRDLKRDYSKSKKSIAITNYFIVSLVMIIAALFAGIFYAGSPQEARERRLDDQLVNKMQRIESVIFDYQRVHEALPDSLDDIRDDRTGRFLLDEKSFIDEDSGKPITYNKVSDTEYELCGEFRTSNIEQSDRSYYGQRWEHRDGEHCFLRSTEDDNLR